MEKTTTALLRHRCCLHQVHSFNAKNSTFKCDIYCLKKPPKWKNWKTILYFFFFKIVCLTFTNRKRWECGFRQWAGICLSIEKSMRGAYRSFHWILETLCGLKRLLETPTLDRCTFYRLIRGSFRLRNWEFWKFSRLHFN